MPGSGAVYASSPQEYNSCLVGRADSPERCTPTYPATKPKNQPDPDPAAPADTPPAAPQLTAEQVAYLAFVKIKLTAPTPVIGPPPSINPWKMAAVGYPLWLWTTGNTNPPPVTDTIAGLHVSLNPAVTTTDFTMGDGTTHTCTGPGQPWTRTVPAAQPSPSCGHTYQQPSLPRGNYTVTATTHWTIDWNANGETGTIPYTQTSTTTLPVGELQVLVH